MTRHKWRAMALGILVGLGWLGCSSESEPLVPGAQPITGVARPELAGPSDLELHETKVRSVLARAGSDSEPELARWRRSPLVEALVDVDGDRFEARWTWSTVNVGAQPLKSVVFEVPINRVADAPAAVALKSVKVGGATVTAGGTSARWEVPLDVAPGAGVEVELVFTGDIARRLDGEPARPGGAAGPAGKVDLSALLGQIQSNEELRNLVPVVPVSDGVAVYGARGASAVLAGCFPSVVALDGGAAGGARSLGVTALEVSAPLGTSVDASGRRLGSDRDGARERHRFAALGAPEIAVFVSRGLATTNLLLAGVQLTFRGGGELPKELATLLRRALEDSQTRWGTERAPRELTVAMLDGLAGVPADVATIASLPGTLLLPSVLVETIARTEPADPAAAAGAPGAAPGTSLSGLLGGMIAHHPASREALVFAMATAVAQQWWAGIGADTPTQTILRQGFPRAAALTVVAGKSGDKAMRRALEFGLKLPLQLALDDGGKDVALSGVTPANDARTSTVMGLKAALFADALARHIGAPTMSALALRLFATASGDTPSLVDLAGFREAVLAVAPRPESTRAFLVRWLDETHLAEDVGPLQPEVLLEYFVVDGAVGSLSSQLMGQLGADKLGGRALELLGQGRELDAGLALTLLGELAGEHVDPSTKKWLTLGTGLFGGSADKKRAIDGLVEELGAELGIPEAERSRLRQLSTALIDALGKDGPGSAPLPAAPPAP